jgi:hypothetical protein
MRTAAEQKANRKIGYLRLATVSSTTAVLIALPDDIRKPRRGLAIRTGLVVSPTTIRHI